MRVGAVVSLAVTRELAQAGGVGYNRVPGGRSRQMLAYCVYHYHYWFHLGGAHAIRQLLGHPDLPQFVGDMAEALYSPERPG